MIRDTPSLVLTYVLQFTLPSFAVWIYFHLCCLTDWVSASIELSGTFCYSEQELHKAVAVLKIEAKSPCDRSLPIGQKIMLAMPSLRKPLDLWRLLVYSVISLWRNPGWQGAWQVWFLEQGRNRSSIRGPLHSTTSLTHASDCDGEDEYGFLHCDVRSLGYSREGSKNKATY